MHHLLVISVNQLQIFPQQQLMETNVHFQVSNVSCRPTQVVVVHHGVGAAQARALLGEVIAELQQRGVFLQNAGYLHLHLVAQRLALEETRTAMSGLIKCGAQKKKKADLSKWKVELKRQETVEIIITSR